MSSKMDKVLLVILLISISSSRVLQNQECTSDPETFYDSNDSLMSYATNICLYASCIMDEQCMSGYCRLNECLDSHLKPAIENST